MSTLTDQLGNFAGNSDHSLLDEDGNVNVDAVGRAPTAQDFANEYAAPGEDALLPMGITYTADWKIYADGIAAHAREQVLSLASTGFPVSLQHFGSRYILTEELHPDVMNVAYLENVDLSRTLISIKHCIVHTPEALNHMVCPGAATLSEEARDQVYRSTILYTSLERSFIHPDLVKIMNTMGQIWVPCSANINTLVDSGVDPLRVRFVPYPFEPSKCDRSAPRGKPDVPPGKRFYHIGKWEPRKNQHKILGAFLQAFKPTESASLLIKTSAFGGGWTNYPSPSESISFWINNAKVKENGWTMENMDSRVRIIMDKIPEDELMAIHSKNNIYVSASSGEAWEIPAFDAKLTGNRMVHAGYGGSEEYEQDGDVRVPYKMVPAHPGYGWEEDAQWAKIETSDLVAALKMAKPAEKRVMPADYVRRFSRANVGRLMLEHIEDLARELGCWDKLRNVGGFG